MDRLLSDLGVGRPIALHAEAIGEDAKQLVAHAASAALVELRLGIRRVDQHVERLGCGLVDHVELGDLTGPRRQPGGVERSVRHHNAEGFIMPS